MSEGNLVLKLFESEASVDDFSSFQWLTPEQRLIILGSYGIELMDGQVSIAGAVLEPFTTHWVHAPHCHALPVIRAMVDSEVKIRSHPGAVALRRLEALNPVFCKLWNEEIPRQSIVINGGIPNTYQIIFDSEDAPKKATIQTLVSPAEWNRKLTDIAEFKREGAPVILICGPKSSGKSTFAKLLLNRLVTHTGGTKKKKWDSVAILDTDPGQPEYAPPGLISLNRLRAPNLSPPFCHPALDPECDQVRAHAIASTSPALNPEHYVGSVMNLFYHHLSTSKGRCPLVVNTPGWIQGTGLDILTDLIKRIRPTHVVYMSQDGPEETVEVLGAACHRDIFDMLPSQPGGCNPRTGLDFRTMQMMSYFHLRWPSLADKYPDWNSTPLSEIRPWRLRYKGESAGFLAVLHYDYQPPPELLAEAMNGMILALVKIEDKAAFRSLIMLEDSLDGIDDELGCQMDVDGNDEQPVTHLSSPLVLSRSAEGIPIMPNPHGKTLDPRYSKALGLVMIRGIDSRRGELQILTPLPPDLLLQDRQSLLLVAGRFETPGWAYTETAYQKRMALGADGQALDELENGKNSDVSEAEDGMSAAQDLDDPGELPWVEALYGNQGRVAGSKVWRVRRDLGRKH